MSKILICALLITIIYLPSGAPDYEAMNELMKKDSQCLEEYKIKGING